MCVGVPARIIELKEYSALVDVLGSQTTVGIIFVPDVTVGDYVIVHAGQAMSVIDEEFAKESAMEWRKFSHARNTAAID